MRTVAVTAVVLIVALGQGVTAGSRPAKPTSPGRSAAAGAARVQKPATPAPKPATTRGPKTPSHGAPATARSTPKSTRTAPAPKTQHKPTTSGSTSVATGAATTTPVLGPNVPKNPKLQERLQARLPAGMTLNEAAEGFKNQGQFVAAVRVSENLGIPFVDLKTRMVDEGLSLGQAIQATRPTADASAEARRGEQQAALDLEQ